MTEFEREVIDRLGRIETKLDNDGMHLYGNGKPGLVDRISKVEADVEVIKAHRSWVKDWLGWLCAGGLTAKEIAQAIIHMSSN